MSSPGSLVPATNAPNLSVIDPSAGQTCGSLRTPAGATVVAAPLDWNVSGPQGPPGTNGAAGAPGKTLTVVGGSTLTLPGGQVVRIGQSSGLTINPPALGNRQIATLTLSDGNTTLSAGVLGFSFASGGAGSSGSAKKTVHDISITKHIDKASPKLFQACVTGKHFAEAKLVLSKGGHSTSYSMTNVLIGSAQANSAKGSAQPTESLTLNFTKIEFKHT